MHFAFRSLLLATALIASAHAADVVWIDGGDRVSGTLEVLDRSTLRITTEWGGVLLINRDSVVAVETERPMNLILPDGEESQARLARDGSGEQVIVDDAGIRTLDLAEIAVASVAPVAEAVRTRWETRITYGLNISSGNTDSQNHALRARSLLRQEHFRHVGNADVDIQKDDGTATREMFRVGYQLDWFFRDEWYAFGSTEYFQDKLRDVDWRVTLGAGIGHQFWETSLGALSVEGGISEVIEEIGGERDNNRALRIGADYNRFFMGQRMELFHKNELLVLAERDRGELLHTSTGLRYAINAYLSANLRVDLDHETEPAIDREKTDVVYIIGFGLTW